MMLPAAPGAQQFGGPRRVEVAPAYPYTAVGKWTYGDGGSRTLCTAFLVNNCTLVTARRCGQGKAGSFQFETSDGQRFQVRNVRADHGDKSEAKPEEPDLDVAFGQIATRAGQPSPGEKYGRSVFALPSRFASDTTRGLRGTPDRSRTIAATSKPKGRK